DLKFNRNSALASFAHFNRRDPRWSVTDGSATPNCNLPTYVVAQNESFLECARVYMCGVAAADCGINRARRTNNSQCTEISRACLVEHPIPQLGTSDPVALPAS